MFEVQKLLCLTFLPSAKSAAIKKNFQGWIGFAAGGTEMLRVSDGYPRFSGK